MAGAKDSLVVREIQFLVVVVVAAATLVAQTWAATYQVGDSLGWQTSIGGYNYSNWAAQHTFNPGDSLVFNFASGVHTAAQVTQDAYDNCNTANPINLQVNGPATFTLTSGTSYFVCTLHCSLGQKLAVNVGYSPGSPYGFPGTGYPPGSPFGFPGTGYPPGSPYGYPAPGSGYLPPRNSATPTRAVAALTFLSAFVAFFC